MLKVFRGVTAIFLMIAILGCTTFDRQNSTREVFKQLSATGAKVQNKNSDLVVVIPLSKLFIANSANFSSSAYPLLDLVFAVSKLRASSAVAVIVEKLSRSSSFERALILARARNIASHLWDLGIDSTVIYTNSTAVDQDFGAKFVQIKFVDFYR